MCSFVGTHPNHFYIHTTRNDAPHLDPHCDGTFYVLGLHGVFRLPSPGVIVRGKMRMAGRITTSNRLVGHIVASNRLVDWKTMSNGLVDQKTMLNGLVDRNTTRTRQVVCAAVGLNARAF